MRKLKILAAAILFLLMFSQLAHAAPVYTVYLPTISTHRVYVIDCMSVDAGLVECD